MYLIRNGAGHRWLAEKKDKEEFQHIVLCNWKPRNVTSEIRISWFTREYQEPYINLSTIETFL